ncbi:MAG: TonB-dependent receptor plug domain-containing protein, partial [Steroidobacteraceae bacterium]
MAVLLIGTLVIGLASPGAQAAGVAHAFAIAAQPLGPALDEFARQADVTLLFSSSLVVRARTTGVHGELAVTEGLSRLLGGTGFTFRQVSPSAIAIVESTAPTAAAKSNPVAPAAIAPAERRGTPSYDSLQEVVVTGTPEGSGVKLLDASFPVSMASLQQIHLAQPSSAADLLKIVPGLWAESSGGETGANIEVAGFPGGADAPYVTYQIEGSPVYPLATLYFMDNSSLLRLDDTIERVEVVQGGPSVVYSNGQIGATANFILRHGTPAPHGEIALTLGSEGLYRLDGFYGGPLGHGWLGSLGGFYRLSDGIRNPQFPANDGGQLTVTLYHAMAGGGLLLWARTLRDKNLFVTDIPIAVSADGRTVSAFPGFDPFTGTFAGNPTRRITVEEFPCGAAD